MKALRIYEGASAEEMAPALCKTNASQHYSLLIDAMLQLCNRAFVQLSNLELVLLKLTMPGQRPGELAHAQALHFGLVTVACCFM